MNFIEKYKALIITSLLMGILLLGLYNIHMLGTSNNKGEMLVELPVEDIMEELEKEKEELDPIQEQRKLIAAKRTHNAYNEDFEDPDDTSFEDRLKALTESPIAESSEDGPNNLGDVSTEEDKEKEETPEQTNTDTNKQKQKTNETNNRNSSLTFTLKGRKAIDLPNPIYTCQGSGKVVVKVQVNANGYVSHSKVDKKNSTTRNECLFDNALDYANQAIFSASEVKEQKGTITYYFNYSE
ncbi:hypothetical protein ACFSTE_01280 [Aquimarina hainanensis]|uniref:Energy transducer TonB n=1 Tax=Aquimarina hainanensis TaxID=1578017 RepID=A0ABW5N4B0_9FLAO